MQKTTTVRFEQETLARLDQIAASLGRPRSWVINDAVTKYLEYEVWFLEEVQRGLDAAEHGDLVTHDEVKDSIRGLGINVD
ncbi:CopG family ribbon-helix-helix protein [Desulfomicrobium escambiense]|uniref:CopG family ribbon-helix-helix protein n=1 Tax=Desulfomicrobium escambiense TaxID=29503 RepID=UPI000408C09A|nr:CopG family ribbon-helix-helix protein [Desulfomicrobium escambiense]